MTPAERTALVESIHASPFHVVLAVTGGGHAVITDLLNVAGASATVLEVVVPYSAASLDALVGGHALDDEGVVQAVSASTASAMASACAARAALLAPDESHRLGVACTATIATNRQKRGDHHGYLCIVDSEGIELLNEHIPLTKGTQSRTEEDQAIANIILRRLAEVTNRS